MKMLQPKPLCIDFKSVYINGLHIATKETAESWRGNQHVAQQTTLTVEVTHFTQDELNILHCGPTWLADKNHTTIINSCKLRVKEGHIKI